jgi:predicted PurR-regulated permease PerM
MPKTVKTTADPDQVTEVSLTISARTIVKVVLLIIGTILALAALRKASHALLLIFTALFLAVALNAPVSWIARHIPGKKRGSRVLGTTTSFIVVVVVLGAFLASITPPIVRQTQSLVNSAPRLIRDVRDENSDIGHFIQKYNLESEVDKFSEQLSERLKNASGSAVSTVTKVGSSIFSLLTILVLTFMMLIEGPRWIKLGIELSPKRRQRNIETVLRDMYSVVKGYVNGQVLLAAIAAVMILPGLLIFGVSYPVALLGVVFICGLIPMVGHTIGAVIVTLVALFTSPLSALGILAYYILYQQIENYLIQPRVQANTTNMSPLLVFASVVIGVSFSGLFGGLVAIPVAGCLRVLVLDYLRQNGRLSDAPRLTSEVAAADTK